MIRRKQAKTITSEEFLSKRKDIRSCDIEDVLCGDYVYLLDSMDMEDFEYGDTSFDIFRELVFENKVVGFVSYMEEKNGPLLMEAYVMPEYRNNALLCNEISKMDDLAINKPKISLVKALIDCGIASEVSDGIVASEMPFTVSSYNLKRDDDGYEYQSYVYDLKNGCVLLLESPDTFNHSQPTRSDQAKYDLADELDDDYLTRAREIISEYDEKYLEVTSIEFRPTIVFLV